MRYFLDTNICVMYLDGRSMAIRDLMLSVSINDLAVRFAVKFELFYEAVWSNNLTRALQRQRKFLGQFVSQPLGNGVVIVGGHIHTILANARRRIEACNLQIAAIAHVYTLILVAYNTQEFERVDELQLEDWEAAV